jgi:hypothetical protein
VAVYHDYFKQGACCASLSIVTLSVRPEIMSDISYYNLPSGISPQDFSTFLMP